MVFLTISLAEAVVKIYENFKNIFFSENMSSGCFCTCNIIYTDKITTLTVITQLGT